VCDLEELAPGELRGFTVPGVTWPIMVAVMDGAPVAFQGVCPHADVSLADYGALARPASGPEVVCRVHGYRFALATGRCEHAPALQLRRYRVTLVDGSVWVDLIAAP
jgi:nitrite reductase/ring-hydroxylating ferredoxin subunit